MGSEKLVVNELLAFLQHHPGIMDEVSVTHICTKCFSEDEIQRAKILLYESLDLADQMPPHQQGEKGEQSLQHIIRLLKDTNPDDVPSFVARELQKLPTVTYERVDVTRLLKDITTIKASLTDVQLKLEESQSSISELRTEVVDLRNTISVCRSVEANNSRSRKAVDISDLSCESEKSDSSSATITPSDVCGPASPVDGELYDASTSRPVHAYSAVASHHIKQDRQQKPKTEGVPSTARDAVSPASHQEQAARDGFIEVKRKKKKPTAGTTRRDNQSGGAYESDMMLRPGVSKGMLYVSRLHCSTKVENVVEYIQKKANIISTVEKLKSRRGVTFASFSVEVTSPQLPTLMQKDFWPKGVVCRHFRAAAQHDAEIGVRLQ